MKETYYMRPMIVSNVYFNADQDPGANNILV